MPDYRLKSFRMGRDIFVTNRRNDDYDLASLLCVAAVTPHNAKDFRLPLPSQVNCLNEIYAHALRKIAATHR